MILTTHHIQKLIIDLNVLLKIIQLLKENIGETLCDLGIGKHCLDTTPEAHSIKKGGGKVDKLHFITTSFWSLKVIVKRIKRQDTN